MDSDPTNTSGGDSIEEPEARRAELDRMRAEVAHLEEQLGESRSQQPVISSRRHSWWRGPTVVVALILLGLVGPLAVLATWAHDEIKDTDRYVATVAPLASDPAVQSVVTQRVTDLIVSKLDVRAVTNQAVDALESRRDLRPGVEATLRGLSIPLANAVESFIRSRVASIVSSQAFADAWAAANRVAHTQMVAVLTGQGGGAVQAQGDAVTLDLGTVIDQVKAQLLAQGFALAGRIPHLTAQFTLVQSADLAKAQNGFRLLSAVATTLPIVALLLLAAAVVVSLRRRRTLIAAALVVVCSMLLLGVLLNAFRTIYLNAVPAEQLPRDAAAAIYDQLVHFIRLSLRAVLVLFLAVAVVAWVSGPSARAVSVRRTTGRLVEGIRHRSDDAGLDTGPFGRFLGKNLIAIRIGLGVVVVLVYVLAAHPTGAWTLGLLGIGAVVLLLVELLARTSPPEEPTPEEDGSLRAH